MATARDTSNLEIESKRSPSVFSGRMHATTRVAAAARRPLEEAPRRRNVRMYRSRTIVLAAIASDIRKRPVRFHEWNGFAYNDREIGYRADFGAHYEPMCAERRARGDLVAVMTKLSIDERRRKSTVLPIGYHTAVPRHVALGRVWHRSRREIPLTWSAKQSVGRLRRCEGEWRAIWLI